MSNIEIAMTISVTFIFSFTLIACVVQFCEAWKTVNRDKYENWEQRDERMKHEKEIK